jgi:membrane protein
MKLERMKKAWLILRSAVERWFANDSPRQSASLAYFGLFSLAPFFLVVISIADWLLGGTSRARFMKQIGSLAGSEVAQALDQLTQNAPMTTFGFGSAASTIFLLVFGASGLFMELQNSLNQIWKTSAPTDVSWWQLLIKKRMASFGLVLSTSFVIAALLLFAVSIDAWEQYWGAIAFPWLSVVSHGGLALIILSLLFGLLFKVVPDVSVSWRDVWVGALATALLFTLGRSAIAAYIVRSGLASTFGAASSVIGLMVWIYYSAMIFLFGAELTAAFARTVGSKRDLPES